MGGCHRHRVLLSQKKSKIPIVVKLDHFPKVRGKNKKIFKLPPPSRWRGWWFLDGDTTWAKQSPDPSDGAGIERWASNVANVAWGPIWSMYGTVDGSEIRRSPVDMVNIRLFIWFYTSQAVQHFFHQQYICLHLYIDTWFLGTWILWVRGEADSQNSLCVCAFWVFLFMCPLVNWHGDGTNSMFKRNYDVDTVDVHWCIAKSFFQGKRNSNSRDDFYRNIT